MKPKCHARRVGLVSRQAAGLQAAPMRRWAAKAARCLWRCLHPIEVARQQPGSARAISKPPSHLLAAGMRRGGRPKDGAGRHSPQVIPVQLSSPRLSPPCSTLKSLRLNLSEYISAAVQLGIALAAGRTKTLLKQNVLGDLVGRGCLLALTPRIRPQ